MVSPRVEALRRARFRRRRWIAVAAAIAILAVIVGLLGGGGALPLPPAARDAAGAATGDPLAWNAGREAAFTSRAATGSAQVIFVKSPGGVIATAARVAAYRSAIERAVAGSGISPDLLEGLVFLESAGRADVIAGSDPSAAVGLTQILAETGSGLLGMHIDLARSARLTRQIAAAEARGASARVASLERRRAAIDDRFDPAKELAATVRYLQIAVRDLGRVDLAIAAYHAGIGNLQTVLRDYDGGGTVSFARLFFDSSPASHPRAWRFLSGLGDDSAFYYWRVLEAERIMRLYRTDRAGLSRLAGLETGYPSTAEVLVPPASTPRFADPSALAGAYTSGLLRPLPRNAAALWLAYSPALGALAPKLGAPRAIYRGLRPAATAMLIEIAAMVHRLGGPRATPLVVSSAAVDGRYLRRLGLDDPPAQTGFTFQIDRRYGSKAQALAFQFVLDRLQSLNLIAWLRGATTIEITVAPDAAQVLAHGV